MLYRVAIFGLFSLIPYLIRAEAYLFVHRSNSSFETNIPLKLQINYTDVVSIKPGEWKLVVVEGAVTNFVINVAFPPGQVDDANSPCKFPRKLINATQNNIQFITLADEFCDVQVLSRSRSLKALDKGGLIEGFRMNNRVVNTMRPEAVDSLTQELVGITLDPSESLSKEEIDSLKLLALEALELREKLAEKEKAMKAQLEEYFELMKALNQLDEGVEPVVHVGMEQGGINDRGEMRYNIRATYSYDIIEEGVKAELIHYPSGAYQLEKSAAALATALSMKKSIEKYMEEYFEPGSIVKIRIIGSADASPIFSPISYTGEFLDIENHTYELIDDYQIILTENPAIDSVLINQSSGENLMREVAKAPETLKAGQNRSITLRSSTGFQENEELAYLRSLGIKHYMMNNIPSLHNTRNEFIHQTKLEQSIGGIFRKVVIELLIEDVLTGK